MPPSHSREGEETARGHVMNSNSFPAMRELEDEVKNASHVLFALDYDGTLTPTIEDPAQAVLSAPTRDTLAALAARKDIDVIVVSGRALRDVRNIVGLADPIYVGN